MADLLGRLRLLREEKNTSARNALALELSDSGDERVLDELIALIQNPELKNDRGTLVHCLAKFNLEKIFNLLVDLQLYGNWEVAHEANNLIITIDCVEGGDAEAAYDKLVNRLMDENIEQWRKAQISELINMFE